MIIRKTLYNDLDRVMSIYDHARKYMRENGNMLQWSGGYPSREIIEDDIANGNSYVVSDEHGKLLCVFTFIKGPDITYKEIYDGQWPNDKEYHVIHRIAVSEHRKGIASFVFDDCLTKSPVIRIDTHKDNIPMQMSLRKNGFEYCGIIHLLSGDERLAFQKERK